MAVNAIQSMINPRSIAIVGASSDPRKVSGRPLKHLLDKGYQGKIYPINPRQKEISGVACVASIADLPHGVDLAVIVLPAEAVEAVLPELAAKGVPAAIIFASGFGELGDAGRAKEASLVQTARKAGIRILGPNCLGLFNAFERVITTFSQYVDGDVKAGPLAFVSQSGAFGTAIAALARNRQMGLGYFVNTGNEADITFVDAMEQVIQDPRVLAGSGYIEGLKDGAGLCRVADEAMRLGKPLVLTKVGRLGAGALAAASHTGSLAGEDRVFDGVVKQKGIVRARNEEHMLDILEAFLGCGELSGNRIGVITQSGGAGVLIADRAEEVGLAIPRLTDETRRKIEKCIPDFGATGNPVDVTGQFVANPAVLSDSVIHTLEDPNIDIGVVWLQLMHAHAESLVKLFAEIKSKAKKPFVVVWVAASQAAIDGLRAHGIVVFRAAEQAIDAIAGVAEFSLARKAWLAEAGERQALTIPKVTLPAKSGALDTVTAVNLLSGVGAPMAPVALAKTAAEAAQLAKGFGAAVAVKVESMDILHKTEVSGVRLNLKTEQDVIDATNQVLANAKAHAPNAAIDGVIVQKMSGGNVEFVIGLKHDPVFGVVIMAGLGGILVEVLKDVAFCKCPVTPSEARRMVGRLKGAPILGQLRGRPAVDSEALIKLLCDISAFGAAGEGRLEELDLNPILLSDKGASCVDVVMILRPQQ